MEREAFAFSFKLVPFFCSISSHSTTVPLKTVLSEQLYLLTCFRVAMSMHVGYTREEREKERGTNRIPGPQCRTYRHAAPPAVTKGRPLGAQQTRQTDLICEAEERRKEGEADEKSTAQRLHPLCPHCRRSSILRIRRVAVSRPHHTPVSLSRVLQQRVKAENGPWRRLAVLAPAARPAHAPPAGRPPGRSATGLLATSLRSSPLINLLLFSRSARLADGGRGAGCIPGCRRLQHLSVHYITGLAPRASLSILPMAPASGGPASKSKGAQGADRKLRCSVERADGQTYYAPHARS